MSEQIFQVSTVGSYPNEIYTITPYSADSYNTFTNGYPYIFRNFLNHHKNPLKNIINSTQDDFNQYITLSGINKNPSTFPLLESISTLNNNVTYIENCDTITFGSDPTVVSITFSAANLRSDYNFPYSFYFFYFTDPNTQMSNGAILYPEQLFINPISLSYDNGNQFIPKNHWTLNVNLVTLSSCFVSFSSNNIEQDVYVSHRNRLQTLPDCTFHTLDNIQTLPFNGNPYQVKYSFYASRMRYDYPIIVHNTTTPTKIIATIDSINDISYIYPNSTFVTFSADYIDITNNLEGTITPLSLAQLHQNPDHNNAFQKFTTTFINSYSNSLSTEVLQLIQDQTSFNNVTATLSDFSNCIYGVNISNGATNTFTLTANSNATIHVPKGSYIGFNYIAECNQLANVLIPKTKNLKYVAKNVIGSATTTNSASAFVYSNGDINKYKITLYSFDNFNNQSGGNTNINSMQFSTEYAPHCYSYKIDLKDSTPQKIVDSTNLNFYLRLTSINNGTSSIQLSAYIASDFNALTYDFRPEMYTDQISYQILTTTLSSTNDFIKDLVCTYGPKNTSYTIASIIDKNSIVNPTLIPILSGKDFTLKYNGNNFQEISCIVKASLKTAAGTLDTYEPILLKFNSQSAINPNNIFLNIKNEKSNSISIDSSFNITLSAWPYVDLTNSDIVWNVSCDNLDVLNYISVNYIDLNGNYIAPVDRGNSVLFSNNTQMINVSGYGPNKIEITLSANEFGIGSLSTNPNIFNYLENGKFLVTPLVELNNLNLTRTIQLKAQIPISGQVYDIPSDVPLNWTWTYDGNTDSEEIPISVNQILNNKNDYTYSSNYSASQLSAVQVNVTPGYSNTVPSLHDVTVTVSTNIVNPPISGSYTFTVDDFPDPSIFSTNFKSYYQANESLGAEIAEASGNNIVTRPDNSDMNYHFEANQITDNVKCNNYVWTLNDNTLNTIGTFQYDIDISLSANIVSTYTSYGYNISAAKIGFSLLSATVTNWISAHNLTAYTYFYILKNTDFYTPLEFIIYPEYAWLSNNTNITLLSTKNFTTSFRPSAYGNKLSNSQTFWVSSNKSCFDEFLYQNLNDNSIVSTISSYDLIDIPYGFNNPISSIKIIPLSLVAHNSSFYPEDFAGVPYSIYKNDTLFTEFYNVTARSIDASVANNVYNNFYLSPCILPYNDLILNYTLNRTDIELDNNPNISVIQNLSASGNGPAVILDGSTVTYYLSSQYWTASATIPAVSGTYSLFNLNVGDPAIPLYSGDGVNAIDNFNLYAKTNILQQIPPSTFNNYLNKPNLWITLSGI